jgi:hypothetical protein
MAMRIEIPSSNAFIGASADITRNAFIMHSKTSDTQRMLWTQVIKTVMQKPFLDSVFASPSYLSTFKFNFPEELARKGDLDWNSFHHIAAYQNLTQLAGKHVPARLVPWQLRFEFAPETHSHLLTISFHLEKEVASVFEEAQWHFWLTETGFCINPLPLQTELSDLSMTYSAWSSARDFKGAGFMDFPVEHGEYVPKVKRVSQPLNGMPPSAEVQLIDMPPLEDMPEERPSRPSQSGTGTASNAAAGAGGAGRARDWGMAAAGALAPTGNMA